MAVRVTAQLRHLARALVIGLCLPLGLARAEDLSQPRERDYYLLHDGILVAGFLSSGLIEATRGDHQGHWDLARFGPDENARRNFNASAAYTSDELLLMSLTLPLAVQLSSGFDVPFANAALIYGEVQSLNLFATTLTKEIVRRPRPYTHAAAACDFTEAQGSEAYVSFFSGHSSASYAAAMAGSILYAERTHELVARHVLWGTEFLLAGLTAQLRVRAGRHYPTDIWAGTLVGAALGLAVPALHGLPLSRIRPSEMAVAGGALLLTNVGGQFVDVCRVLTALGCQPQLDHPAEARTPGANSSASAVWSLLPALLPTGIGLKGIGSW